MPKGSPHANFSFKIYFAMNLRKIEFHGGKSNFPRNAQKTPALCVFILHKSKAKLSLHCMVPEWIWSIVLWASICDLTHMLYCSSDSSRSCNRSSMCLFFLMMARSKVSWRTPTSWINSFDFASLRMPLHLTTNEVLHYISTWWMFPPYIVKSTCQRQRAFWEA